MMPSNEPTEVQRRVALQQTLYRSRNATRRYLHATRRAWVEEQIARASTANGGASNFALELGPGSGIYLSALGQVAQTVLAVDIDFDMLHAAREAVDDPQISGSGREGFSTTGFIAADICRSPLADASIDLILCSEVIEHVEDSEAVLTAMVRLLKPDGRLILTTPQPLSPLEILGKVAFLPGIIHLLRALYREPIEPTGHINVLSRRALEQQMRRAGLCVEQRASCGFYLPIIAEFGGSAGANFLRWCDRHLRNSPLSPLQWTQCYVLKQQA
ncbi:MAG: hypothetical protein Cons2KO_13700 [Congregibacter sp.]